MIKVAKQNQLKITTNLLQQRTLGTVQQAILCSQNQVFPHLELYVKNEIEWDGAYFYS